MIISDLVKKGTPTKFSYELGDTLFIDDKHYKVVSIKKTLWNINTNVKYEFTLQKTSGQKSRDGENE